MEVGEVLNRFYAFSIIDQVIVRKLCSFNFLRTSHKSTDFFGIKSVISTEVFYSVYEK